MTHDEIWDDSALVESWNEALEEYKRYHSIHAKGGSADEVLEARRADAKPETSNADQPMEVGELDGFTRVPLVGETISAEQGMDTDEPDKPNLTGGQAIDQAGTAVTGAHEAACVPGPQVLLGSVQDESLKKLLMSWYYAGYYTGLYEGHQQAASANTKPQAVPG